MTPSQSQQSVQRLPVGDRQQSHRRILWRLNVSAVVMITGNANGSEYFSQSYRNWCQDGKTVTLA